jgi:Phosphoribosylpyrophosphate synthetase
MEKRHQKIAVFSGTAHLELAEKICKKLALKQGKADIGRFSDGEISVKIQRKCKRKRCLYNPPNLYPFLT